MYEVKHAAAKGLGVFATKNIPRGTRIFAERPIFSVRNDGELYSAFKGLSEEDKDHIGQLSVNSVKKLTALDSLSAAWRVFRGGISTRSGRASIGDYTHLLAAFRNNNFDVGDNTRAIFRNISRTNHSCVPNSQGNFNTAIGKFTIHAVKAIEPDEEITLSYLDEHGALRDARQARLYDHYGFMCQCPICDISTPRGKESERRRKAFKAKLAEFVEAASNRKERDIKAELQMLQMLINLFEKEGLVGRELASM
jgi:hypothetical protein